MAEIENKVARLAEDGWRVERVTYRDQTGEPFIVFIVLSVEGESALEGKL